MDNKIIFVLLSLFICLHLSESGKFINVDNYQYYLSHPLKKNWFGALQHCTFHCLVLVDIKDEEENDRILSIIKHPDYINDPTPHYWTSGTDLGSEGQFFWASSGQSIVYSDYANAQPDNAGKVENCLEVRGNFGWKWNDHVCEEEKYFICRNLIVEKPVHVANASYGYTYV